MRLSLVLLLLLACFAVPNRARAADTSVVIGFTSIKDCVALFAAKEQGYFQQHGLNVELRPVQNSAAQATAIIGGSMTLGCSTPPVLLQALSRGVDLIGIAGASVSTPTDKASAMVARPDAGIAKPEDFIGKKVGVSGIGSANYVIFNAWLMAHHIDIKRVNIFEVPFSTMYDVLKRGTVDAVASVTPILTRIINDKTGVPVVYLLSTMPTGTPLVIYVSTGRWANENPKLVNDFRAAVSDGSKFVLAHPDVADTYIAKYMNQPLETVKESGYSQLDSRLTTKQMRWWVDAMKEQGLIQTEFPGSVVAR